MGELMTEEELVKEARKCDLLVSVGDLVSLSLLQNDVLPQLMIYDRLTERRPMTLLHDRLQLVEGRKVSVDNPPGFITPELVEKVSQAFRSDEPTQLMVRGEEDLAGLVCAALAPDRSCLVYGLPGKGMALVHVDEKIREHAKRMIYAMEGLD